MTWTASIPATGDIAALRDTRSPGRETPAREIRSKRSRNKGKGAWQFRLILAASYPIFLSATVAKRLSPQRLMQRSVAPSKNVFAEARELASNTLPYAFMG
jgi:hypothetical protein